MSIVKILSRKIIFPILVLLRMEKVLSVFSRNKRLVLCYHGCNPNPDFKLNGRHIPLSQFEEHLVYYKKNFNIVSLSEMFRLYKENIIPAKKTIAITFDDGYHNNYTQVFPLLKKHDISATFFIVSSALVDGSYVLWPDIVDIIKAYSGVSSLELDGITFHKVAGSGYYSNELKLSLHDHIKNMGTERTVFMDRLMSKTNFDMLVKKIPVENYKFINASEIKSMSESSLVEIGSHSHTHYNLGNINAELVREELMKSKKIIEGVIGREVNSIAFPDGSYNEHVKKSCEEAGYDNLIAVSYQCSNDLTDKNILPRLTISNTTTFESNMIQVNLNFKKRGF